MQAENNLSTPFVAVSSRPRPEGDDSTCLRPLGLCELGGSCDACWYSPEHPRFKAAANPDTPQSV